MSQPNQQHPATGTGAPQDSAATALDQQVAELSAQCNQLQTARATTEAAVHARDRILLAIDAEVRGPFEGVVTMLQMLQRDDLSDEQRRQIAAAGSATTTLALGMLDTLLDLPAVDEGRLNLEQESFELAPLLKGAVNALQPIAANEGLQLTIRLHPTLPTEVVGDAARFRQILLYVVYRAIDLAVRGDVAVVVSTESRTEDNIVIRCAAYNGGEMITTETQDHIQTLVDDTSADGGGGLGMAEYRKLAEAMGGRIGVELVGETGFAVGFSATLDNISTLHDDRRQDERRLQEMLQCNLGPVIDMSASGLRVLCRRAPRRKVSLILGDTERMVQLKAEVMWTKCIGTNQFEIGLRFIDPTEDDAKQLLRISRKHGLHRVETKWF